MKLSHLLLALASVSLMAGCASTINTVENANKSAAMRIMDDTRIETDAHLAEDFAIVRMNKAENAAGFLRVQMEMENFTRSYLTVYAKIEWYDENAMIIETAGGGWQQYVFEPRESRSVVFTAPSRNARDFRLKLKDAD